MQLPKSLTSFWVRWLASSKMNTRTDLAGISNSTSGMLENFWFRFQTWYNVLPLVNIGRGVDHKKTLWPSCLCRQTEIVLQVQLSMRKDLDIRLLGFKSSQPSQLESWAWLGAVKESYVGRGNISRLALMALISALADLSKSSSWSVFDHLCYHLKLKTCLEYLPGKG